MKDTKKCVLIYGKGIEIPADMEMEDGEWKCEIPMKGLIVGFRFPDSGVDIEYSKVMNEGDVMHFIGLNDSINRFKYKAVSGRKAK